MNINSRFPGTCKDCGCRFPAGTEINWTREFGAKHLTVQDCEAALATREPEPEAQKIDASPIVKFLSAAKDRGLKWPKATFIHQDSTLRLSVSGSQSRVPGSVQVKLDGEWVGRVEPDGTVYGRRLIEDGKLLDTLTHIAEHAAEAAKQYGSISGQCSFCNRTLSDAGSIEVGYGPICAEKYGLPHTPKGTPTEWLDQRVDEITSWPEQRINNLTEV